jgi:hypothetical protein
MTLLHVRLPIMLGMVLTGLLFFGGTAPHTMPALAVTPPPAAGWLGLPPRGIRFHAQRQPDLVLKDFIVTQAVDGEPLIVGKATIARAVIAFDGSTSYPAKVDVQFAGKTFSRSATITAPQTIVDVPIDSPGTVTPAEFRAEVHVTGELPDADLSNNSKELTLPVVMPTQNLVAFFLPVDWTPEQMERYNFSTNFPKFVQDSTDFLRATYPLADDQVVGDFTLTPHMLTVAEKQVADSTGNEDVRIEHLLYATIAFAARRLRPDATLVIGVFPPGWFDKHGRVGVLGLTLPDVKGTVTGLFTPSNPIIAAHELGHLFWLYEDYDVLLKPPKKVTLIDRPGYWVQKGQPEENSDTHPVATFLSRYTGTTGFWVDSRIYEYLLAKFTVDGGGQASGPMVLAATMAKRVEPDPKNYPSEYSAGFQRFEPTDIIYCSVAVINLRAGQTLEARWFVGDQNILTDKKLIENGTGWYSFGAYNADGLTEGDYRVEIYLDGQLAKVTRFSVKSSQ